MDELPDTLDETYARTLEDIDQNWEYALRLFQCVAVASRPLHVKELAEFLAFDFEEGSTPEFLAEWRPEDPAHAVLSTCSSLLSVVDVDGSSVVQFAHFSVKEYLTSVRLSGTKNTISRFYVSITAAHTIVAQACLGALLHLDENITKDGLSNFPLAEYAAEHWVDHALFENVSPNVQDGMKRLFDPSKCYLSVWVWIYDPENFQRQSEHSERPTEARASQLHYASFLGMHDISTFLIVERSQHVNAQGFDKKETPLHVASRRGHSDVTQLLLQHDADTEAQDDDKCTPLLLASRREYADVARVLLKYGANREARDSYICTPLLLASMHGYVEVARVLLEHEADKNAQDERGWSPLMHASKMGHVEIVRVLLKYGADMEARDVGGWTSLVHASKMGDVEITRVLLEQGADVKEQYKHRYTPLHYASSHGRLAVSQLLVEHGADVNARNAHNQTPLHEAKGEQVARFLIEHGADANALDAQNRTPLHQASEDGITEVTRVLLEYGADTNARDADDATPLDLARRSVFWRSKRRVVEQMLGLMLPDDILVEIFYFYAGEYLDEDFEPSEKQIIEWIPLVHVCRRWRSIVFQSPRRLNLRLLCTTKTPAGYILDTWPLLPLIIRGILDDGSSGADNIIAALEHNDHVRQIQLNCFSSSQLEYVTNSAAMQKPFPELTDMRLGVVNDNPPILPYSFLGGTAPLLRSLRLSNVPFPGLFKLLLSPTHLVDLDLSDIPRSGYIRPKAMVTGLSILTSLESFCLSFRSPRPRPALESLGPPLPPPIRSILPSLTKVRFKGASEYLEEILAKIDAPRLNELDVTFFNDITFNIQQLFWFIGRRPTLRALEKGHFTFDSAAVIAKFSSQTSDYGVLSVKILCAASDWQLSSLEQVCTSSLPPVSTLGDLYIVEDSFSNLRWQDEVENILWLDLLHPFVAVKNLYLSDEFVPRIAPALQELVGESTTEVLPALENIFLEGFQPSGLLHKGIQTFVATRQLASRPLSVSRWDKDSE